MQGTSLWRIDGSVARRRAGLAAAKAGGGAEAFWVGVELGIEAQAHTGMEPVATLSLGLIRKFAAPPLIFYSSSTR
jgi:hypothetical protein